MKRFVYVVMAMLIVAGVFNYSPKTTSAESEHGPLIRIGIVPEADEVQVGSEGSYRLIDKKTGEVLAEDLTSPITAALASSAEVHKNYRLQIAWTTSQPAIEDWLNRAEEAGYPTYLQPYNGGYRLFIGEFDEDASWSVRSDFRKEMIRLGLAGGDSFWKVVTIVEGQSAMTITGQDVQLETTDPVVLKSDDLLMAKGKHYRGVLELNFNSKGSLVVINELPIEQYLYGVVPRELPPNPYDELEALKAQAVAARTYAMAGMGKRQADGYDLLPTTSDQVYGGYDVETSISNQAVDETAGVVAKYDGNLISAVYHSTSGGFTANNEDVWDSEPVPYLRGVPDAERGKAFEHVPSLEVFKNHGNPISLRNQKAGDYESDWSKYHRWTFTWTQEEIQDVLSLYYGKEVGHVNAINVVERSNSGRILKIEFVTENGTFSEYKDRVRWALKYVDADGDQHVLLSTLFYIEPVVDHKTKEVTGFTVYGGGWGHGVGMSQTGAVGMAEKGYQYQEILKHYYQGIDLETVYSVK